MDIITTLTLPPGVTVGPLDDTGTRVIYRHGAEIGSVIYQPYLGPETAGTWYTVTVGGEPYRGIHRPLMAAVVAVDALTS